jgi:SAM-dependent methyltransferase
MDYIHKFNGRVEGYIYASSKYDHVLKNENLNAVKYLDPIKGDKILHISSVGVNFKKYINNIDEIDITEVESNPEFALLGNVKHVQLNKLPYENNYFDKIIVIASFHHINNDERVIIYKEIYRILKQNGIFILADVKKDSMQAHFLNDFLDKYNPIGHNGMFFNSSDIELFKYSGFETTIKEENYTWDFNSIEELNDFCYNLFYLKNIKKEKIFEEIKKYLTIIIDNDNNLIKWNWLLLFFISKKI